MKGSQLLLACLILAVLAFRADSEEVSQVPDVSLGDATLDRTLDRVYARLQPLFRKYYPKAFATNLHRNGIRFEHEVTTFEFPNAGPRGRKRQRTTRRGPKNGGIGCSVFIEKGPYVGQVAIASAEGSTSGPMVVDNGIYKVLLMAPYSVKQDAHLWVALSYPADASAEFLKGFVTIIESFEKDGGTAGAQNGSKKPANVLEGRLRVHSKFHYRFYIDGFGDGQACALFGADERLNQIKPGSLVRVRGDLASKFFARDPRNKTPALGETWTIYMDIEEIQVLAE